MGKLLGLINSTLLHTHIEMSSTRKKKKHPLKSCLSTAALITWKCFVCQETFEEILLPVFLLCPFCPKVACVAFFQRRTTLLLLRSVSMTWPGAVWSLCLFGIKQNNYGDFMLKKTYLYAQDEVTSIKRSWSSFIDVFIVILIWYARCTGCNIQLWWSVILNVLSLKSSYLNVIFVKVLSLSHYR